MAWFSGLANHADATDGIATHCSAFVASACERLGEWREHERPGADLRAARRSEPPCPPDSLHAAFASLPRAGAYTLRPPDKSQILLANAQANWTQTVGLGQGWTPLSGPIEAQALANRGHLVLFLRRNADATEPGHAALVRPYAQADKARVLGYGPRVAQASTINSASTDMNLAGKTVRGACMVHGRGPAPRSAARHACAAHGCTGHQPAKRPTTQQHTPPTPHAAL